MILKRVFCSSCNRIFFKDCWKPAVEVLDLKWIDLFSTGVYVEEEDVCLYRLEDLYFMSD